MKVFGLAYIRIYIVFLIVFFGHVFALSRAEAAVDRAEQIRREFKVYTKDICVFKLHDIEFTKPVESAIVFGVERIYDTYKESFGFPYPDDFKVKVTIIADQKDFFAYQKDHIGKIISKGGYYSGRHRETVVWKNKSAEEMLSVLFHEASHMILRMNAPWIPHWVDEGFAVYFEGLNVIGKYKRIELNKNRMDWCKYWQIKGFPIAPAEYVSLDYEQWEKLREKDANAAYTIGYSLVYYMMSSSKTQKIIKELLWEYARRGPEGNSIEVINKNYPGGFKNLERIWRKWIPRARKYRPLKAIKKK